ncbi:MAG: ABC transporter ATP-binding protein [Balneolaceae bacterium]|nr:MAG: ABC transporter ATP-binding protein [Balneolaceae bacterium]
MIELRSAFHEYNAGTVVKLPDLTAGHGEELLILGLSGSGKTTLLHVLAGLLKPTGGSYRLDGTDLYSLGESERDRFRGNNIGLIFQAMHLIRSLTVLDNLKLAQYMAGRKQDEAKIRRLCSDLDIGPKLYSYPDELSHGQKQRVSIARAVVNDPVLLLADEPTSSLDDLRSGDVLNLLRKQAAETGATLIISTHDQRVKAHIPTVLTLDQPEGEVAG